MRLMLIFAIAAVMTARASETVTPEPDSSAYHYVSHYSIDIDAPAGDVWTQLIKLEAWMYEFDLTLESGTAGEAGETRRLYAGQDFFVEITKVIPNELLVFANLPSTFNDESSIGVAVMTLNEANGETTVNLTLSRRYSFSGSDPNPQRAVRESAEFQERTRAMWEDRFLERLKSLAEGEHRP